MGMHDLQEKIIAEKEAKISSMHYALDSLRAAIEKHGNWDDGCFYYNGKAASELQEPLAKARAALQRSKEQET